MHRARRWRRPQLERNVVGGGDSGRSRGRGDGVADRVVGEEGPDVLSESETETVAIFQAFSLKT